MIRAHRIELDLNNQQRTYCAKAAGIARFAFNWALAEWKKEYELGLKPTECSLRRQLNSIKKSAFPWMLEVTKCAPQMAIKDLGKAYQNFFEKRAAYPKFKKKGFHDSFTLSNDHFSVSDKKIRIPHLGWVKMRESLRFKGKILWATVSKTANRWFVSISVEVSQADSELEISTNTETVGVDLGISTLATLSNGEKFQNPNALEKLLGRLKRLSKRHSKKVKGSKNRKKSALSLAKLHARISNIRSDALHKITTALTSKFGVICLEDLNVKGMTKNKHLARRLMDSSFGEFRRQMTYKAEAKNARIIFAPRFYPSSKNCSACDIKNEDLKLSDREWTCKNCGIFHKCRDINAAINLKKYAVSSTVTNACGGESSGPILRKKKRTKLAPVKQESGIQSEQSGLNRS